MNFALKGKICCGNCNRQLRHERQYGEMVFYCGYKRSAGKFSKCYGGYYREYSVNAKVARAIKNCVLCAGCGKSGNAGKAVYHGALHGY